MKAFASLQNLVQSYLSGSEEGSFNGIFIKEGELVTATTTLAKRTSDGEVLLGRTSDIPEELNDALLTTLASTGTKFSRIGDMRNLLNAPSRIEDLKNGNVDQFATIVKIYGGDIAALRIGAHEALRAFDAEIATQRAGLLTKVKELEGRVTDFFNGKKTEQIAKRAEIEKAMLEESVRTALDDWTAGKVINQTQMNHITKSGHRLRLLKRSTRTDVQSTSGQSTSLNMIRQGFNKLAPYLWGGKTHENSWDRRALDNGAWVSTGSVRSYDMKYKNTNGKITVGMGCQQVPKEELERFALAQGWPLDGTTVPA